MFGNVEIDLVFILAQAVGFIATGVAIYSFQAKHRVTMLTMQTASNLMWMVHYFMLGSLSAVFANFIGTVRNIIYGMRGKYKFADSKIVPAVSIIAFIIAGIFTYTTPFDILPTLAMIFASIAFFVKEERLIRCISVFIAISWLVFGFYAGSIAGIISDGSTFISIVIAMIRYRDFKLYEKETLVSADKKSEDDCKLESNQAALDDNV